MTDRYLVISESTAKLGLAIARMWKVVSREKCGDHVPERRT